MPTEALLAQGSPTEYAEPTEVFGREYPPTDFTDAHRFFFSTSRFWVTSVGRWFGGSVGMAGMPYPPIVGFVGAAETAAPPGGQTLGGK